MTPEQTQRLEEMAVWLIENPGVEESLCAECFTAQGEEILTILRDLKERAAGVRPAFFLALLHIFSYNRLIISSPKTRRSNYGPECAPPGSRCAV